MGLEMVEIVMVTESHFHVDMPDSRVREWRTYGDLLDGFCNCIREQRPTSRVTENDIDSFLRRLLERDYGVCADHIHREAVLYGKELDLG
jgi:hypothetical protein